MKNKNPHGFCTWDEHADCQTCGIHGKLACKWDKNLLSGFYGIAGPPILAIIFGIVIVGFLTGAWWPLYSYIIYFFLMFGIFEIRFLCSHCPYYAEDGKILHCLANHGSFKLWKYHPGPLNKFEKFMMYFLIVTVFFVFPFSILGYGIWYLSLNYAEYGLISLLGLIGITAVGLVSSISFINNLKTFFCPNCVNFSCPLNTVAKPVIDEYLKKNDVMRKAWEESGWQLDPTR
jgi:MFS family permease